jgi:hypothetical protein
MLVYPFESQLGTSLVNDPLTTMFPVKYRWPVFDLAAAPAQDFQAIIDEECRVRIRTPHVSKFRDAPMDLSDATASGTISRACRHPDARRPQCDAFFGSTFDAWKDHVRRPHASVYVGYSPIIGVGHSAHSSRSAGRACAARGTESMGGVCRHEEAAETDVAGELHGGLDHGAVPRAAQPRAASETGPYRSRRRHHG